MMIHCLCQAAMFGTFQRQTDKQEARQLNTHWDKEDRKQAKKTREKYIVRP